eukprot:1157334-Pelagomonas_calceolata.AAC.22
MLAQRAVSFPHQTVRGKQTWVCVLEPSVLMLMLLYRAAGAAAAVVLGQPACAHSLPHQSPSLQVEEARDLGGHQCMHTPYWLA